MDQWAFYAHGRAVQGVLVFHLLNIACARQSSETVSHTEGAFKPNTRIAGRKKIVLKGSTYRQHEDKSETASKS